MIDVQEIKDQIILLEKRIEKLESNYANLFTFVEELNEIVTSQELRLEKLEKFEKEIISQFIAMQAKNETGDSMLSKKK